MYFVYALVTRKSDLFSTGKPEIYLPVTNKRLKLENGVIKSFDIEIENRGSKELKILDLSTSCGCLIPQKDSLNIPAGQKAYIPLTFKDVTGTGVRDYEVVGNSNDVDKPYFKYKIEVTVTEYLAYKPLKDGEFLFYKTEQNSSSDILKAEVNLDKYADFLSINYEEKANRIHGKIKYKNKDLCGYLNVPLTCSLEINKTGSLTKSVFYGLYRNSKLFNTNRAFYVGRFRGDKFNEEIVISGLDPAIHTSYYEGTSIFEGQAEIVAKNTVRLICKSKQNQYSTTEKGHIFIKDIASNKVVFSHPVYIKY